jgi:hypothetical protein
VGKAIARARGKLEKVKLYLRARWVFFVYAVLTPISIVIWFAVSSPSSFASTPRDLFSGALENLPNYGGVLSFLITLGIVFWFRFPEHIKDLLGKAKSSSWGLIFLILGFGGLIGIWFAVRTIGFYAFKFLREELQVYSPSIVFSVLSYILTANLIFTLLRAFEELGCKKTNEDTPTSSENTPNQDPIRSLLGVLIQGLIILIISVVPRYSDPELPFDQYWKTIILVISSLAVLLFAQYRLVQSNNNARVYAQR